MSSKKNTKNSVGCDTVVGDVVAVADTFDLFGVGGVIVTIVDVAGGVGVDLVIVFELVVGAR